ncbi:MAG: DEAD/DEAH box helicase [Planctomycetota bacterium]
MNAFDRLHPALQHHIVNSLGWNDLRDVQSLSIEGYDSGANLVILAPTAGGKTEAAFFPVISRMLEESWPGISVLYVSPIKALLNNQKQRLDGYLRLVGRRAALWHGDTTQGERKRILSERPDCLLTTPESLEVMLVSRKIEHAPLFRHVRVVVIDELHAFAGDDRGWHLLSVFSRIGRIAGRDMQRIGLSATVGNPEEMLGWLSSGSERPQQVVWPRGAETQSPDVQLDFVGSLANAAKIISLLHQGEKRLVFCDSRSRVEQLAFSLRQRGVDTFVSHSSLGLDERRRAEEAFAQRQNCVIVATSSLELGLDIGDLDRVIQIDAPGTVSSFLQRMGRTGRRLDTSRNCLFLATSDEGLLRAASLIELWRQGYVEPVQAPPRPYHILAQQLMALILQEQGIGRSQWFPWVKSVPGFADMPSERISELVDFMVTTGIIWSDDGILGFAPEGEAKFGRRNFMDLLSVFTAPPLFKVMFGQKELGYVHESTFYRQEAGPAILVLAGRSWETKHLDWKRRLAHVEPTDEKGRSRWLGEGQMLSHAVCQSIRRLVASDADDPAWSQRAAREFAELRDEHPWASFESTSLVQHPNKELRWWTFAGGMANTLLADTLKPHCDVKSENLSLSFPAGPSVETVSELINGLTLDAVRPIVNIDAMETLKFSECLPSDLAADVFRSRFDDRHAVQKTLSERRKVIVIGSD